LSHGPLPVPGFINSPKSPRVQYWQKLIEASTLYLLRRDMRTHNERGVNRIITEDNALLATPCRYLEAQPSFPSELQNLPIKCQDEIQPASFHTLSNSLFTDQPDYLYRYSDWLRDQGSVGSTFFFVFTSSGEALGPKEWVPGLFSKSPGREADS
jgi:hypothetical protein